MKKLTEDQWSKIEPPFCWLRLDAVDNHAQRDIMEKLIESKSKGWWYRIGTYFFFENSSDRAFFKLWLETAFADKHGEI